MSLQLAAQHLASKGRGPDTMLVHMAPGEVKSLQALARANGGTLTTNPDTGLPEAGFLRAILPLVAGAALGPAGMGLTAMQAGLATAALGTVATGSLRQGLMAGLGAYGGAGLMGTVTGAGNAAITAGADAAAAAGNAGIGAAVPQLPPVTDYSVMAGADPTVMGYDTGAFGATTSPVTQSVVTPTALPPMSPGMSVADTNTLSREFGFDSAVNMQPGAVTPTPTPITAQPAVTPSVASGPDTYRNQMDIASDRATAFREAGPFGPIKAGLSEIGKDPSKFMTMDNLRYGMAASAPLMMQEPEKRAGYDGGGPNPYQYEYDAGRTYASAPAGSSSEVQHFDPRFRRMASGGLSAAYAAGGQSHLGDYSDGGRLLRGPGDGVSDSIPATIADKRPARLADGEFVVPARVVSELGNGSTDAGARKLYAMMDRVQKARNKTVGKGKVAVNSRADKYLPA